MRTQPLLIGSAVALLLGSLAANGEQLDIVHAKLDQASASAGLQAAIATATRSDAGPSWIGYEVPAVADGEGSGHSNRGWNSCSADLEEGSNHTTSFGGPNEPSSRRVLIFLRTHQQQIEKVRMFEGSCRVDADGMPVHWLADVRPAESVELLRTYVLRNYGNEENHSKGAAVAAIASTDDPSADAAMQQFTSASSPVELRKESVFWLGAARGRKGYEMLRIIVKADPSDEVRDRAIFALSVSPAPEAVDTLIDEARNDSNSHLREQALFWLAHKAGVKAAGAITSAVENDPDTEVKKKAVFALTQLPPDQGVPMLIKVAETNRNPEVRKRAFFWLGQSHDPRAFAFITRVLTN
ncbi:MAG: HEAT repeat domain-containing protein [Terriglobia bacterium]